jgi:hypothetical protein
MLLLSIGGFTLGAEFFPQRDGDPALPPILGVHVTGSIDAGSGWRFLDGLTWTESQDDKHQLKAALAPHTTRVGIMANYAKKLFDYDEMVYGHDVPIVVDVDIPDSAEVVKVDGGLDLYGRPNKIKSHMVTRPTNKVPSSLLTKLYLQVEGVVSKDNTGMSFIFDVKGVDRLTFSTNRTRAAVRMPGVTPMGQSPMPMVIPPPKFTEIVAQAIPDGGKYAWSERPKDEADDAVEWSRESDDTSASNTAITGVRDDVLRHDHEREFWAGIVFALAGAAVIGLVQSLFSACRERGSKRTV